MTEIIDNGVTVIIKDIVSPHTEFVYTRGNRSKMSVEQVLPGGESSISFQIPCGLLAAGLPHVGSTISLYDLEGGSVPFRTFRMDEPKISVVQRVVTNIVLSGVGWYKESEDQRFRTAVSFGPSSTGSIITEDKQSIADITDAVKYAVSEKCPDIIIDNSYVQNTGINIRMDSQSFTGQTAEDVLNYFAGLTSYLSTPFIWRVMTINGSPYLIWMAQVVNPYYWDDGLTSWDASYDLKDVINVCTIGWGNNQRWTEPFDSGGVISGPLAYAGSGGSNIERDKYVNVANEFTSEFDVQALAGGYLNKFNALLAKGSVKVSQPLRTIGDPPTYVSLQRIEVGHAIGIALPDGWPSQLAVDVDWYFSSVKWDEDQCVTTCSFGEISGLFKDMRRIIATPAPGLTWATAFGGQSIPRDLGNDLPVIGPQRPSSSLFDIQGITVDAVTPMAAMTTTGGNSGFNHDFGPMGGQIMPPNLPDNFSEITTTLRSADGVTALPVDAVNAIAVIPIAKNYIVSGWIIATGQAGAITVEVKLNGTLLVDLVQPSGQSATGTFTETTLVPGDVLTVFVTSNGGGIALAAPNINGNKHWPNFPTYPAPTH